ncbi:MAG: hypothetical protein WDN26_05820 [Chitinophagaceae bacterium]
MATELQHKKIIALQGISSSGKTITIKKLNSLLLENGYSKMFDCYNEKNELVGILQKGEVLVGISSLQYDIAQELFEILIKRECRIIICAHLSRELTIELIQPFKGYVDYQYDYVLKTFTSSPTLQERVNQADAIQLFGKVQAALTSN